MPTILAFLTLIAVYLLISFLSAWPAMMLWNGCLVGAVTGVNEISWLQAWGIVVLAGIVGRTQVKGTAK